MIWYYLAIFLIKILEVTLGTVRLVLITKGERVKGTILGIIEAFIWLALVSTVLDNVTQDPIKAVLYGVGFGVGNFLGSLLEEAGAGNQPD